MKFLHIIHLAEYYWWEFFENFRFIFSKFFSTFKLKKNLFRGDSWLEIFLLYLLGGHLSHTFFGGFETGCNMLTKYQNLEKTRFSLLFYNCKNGGIPTQSEISNQYMNKLKVHIKGTLFPKFQVLKCISQIFANLSNF